MFVFWKEQAEVSVTGIDDHELPGLDMNTLCCTHTDQPW